MKKNEVFYGWWIVGCLFIINAYVSGVITIGFTASFEPIAQEFSWSYATVSFAASLRGLETGVLAPIVGLLLDRFGSKKLITIGSVFIGLSFLLISRITSLWMFYSAFALIGLGTSLCIGVLPLTVIGNWFRKNVTLATGIVVSGYAAGGILLPLVTLAIDSFTWRVAMVIFGFSSWIILIPLSLLIRHSPEPYGYLPYGDISESTDSDSKTDVQLDEVKDTNVKNILGSGDFWHISLGFMLHVVVVTSLITHMMPYLSSIGMDRSTASFFASAVPISSILGRLTFGWLGDKFNKKMIATVGIALTGLGIFFFDYAVNAGPLLLIPFLIILGLAYGGPVPMLPALMREYFGRKRLGTAIGLAHGVTIVGMFMGPPLTGWIFDRFGSYQIAWYISAGIAILGAICVLTTAPKRSAGQVKT